MIRSVYHFHVYYHVRRVLERLQTPLPEKNFIGAISVALVGLTIILVQIQSPGGLLRNRWVSLMWDF